MVKIKMPTKAEYEAARRRGERATNLPTALLGAKLDSRNRVVHLFFRNGMELRIPVREIREIASVPLARLADVAASPLGDGLIFDKADVAIYVPGLVRDLFAPAIGSALGKSGGRIKTPAKSEAARRNGRKGGRPRKRAA
jgi:hypothetical protein